MELEVLFLYFSAFLTWYNFKPSKFYKSREWKVLDYTKIYILKKEKCPDFSVLQVIF